MPYYGYGDGFCRVYGLFQGDKIQVFSGGRIMGTGSFIRVEGPILVWVDRNANMNFTDLRVSSVRKITGGCCPDNDVDVVVNDF
ncbi:MULTISPECIES: hypothetical protein [Bacillus cereus group]|uniref:hypothetical protein n=1 Tax=Bacillus cereus group TaxID=86661 RepID=UPI000994B469|nr:MULTISPECIES: hypothetical protein [Bacillus cereus group]OPA07534.1 hypothetical protein BHL54_25245 [Bacillus cereus]PEL93996.1 hypothetical protein CN602_29495 [Bacillus cereus]PGW49200.1 hypothetical protein COE03_11570 [Bacillus thuringiensis]